VRLPRAEREEPTPPSADQIEVVLGLVPILVVLLLALVFSRSFAVMP
jgi:hypothetical protein